MANIADAGFTPDNKNGNKENTEVNKEVVDESNVETVQKDSKGDEQKFDYNLKYPLDDNDYKGTLVFHTIVEDRDNELVEQLGDKLNNKLAEQIKEFAEEEGIPEEAKRLAEQDPEVIALREENLTLQTQGTFDFDNFASYYPTYTENEKLQENQQKIKEITGQIEERLTEEAGEKFRTEQIAELSRGQVKLYMPMALNFRDNVGYENVDLGFSGGLVEGGLGKSKGSKMADVVASVIGGTGKTLASLIGSQTGDLATLAALQVNVVAKALGEGAVSAVRQAGGVRLNPNTRSLFKSVALREFAFQFKFIAKSFAEAEEVKKIIHFFRKEIYPEDINISVGGNEVSVGYKFPKKFQITALYDGKPVASKIKPCFLRDVSITYNPTNQTMHGGDNPHFTEIDMSLAFTETTTLSRKDIVHLGF